MGTTIWRFRVAVWVLALAVVAAACSVPERNDASSDPRPATESPEGDRAVSTTEPRRDATLTGAVVSHDGAPLGGLPVTVVVGRPSAVADALLTAVFTLGIACVASPRTCDPGARVADSATTGPDGRFELTLPKAYLPGYETDEDWVVQVGRAPGEGETTGPSSSFELEVNTPLQAAPDLALWDATPAIADEDGLLRVHVPAITGGAELTDRSVRFLDDNGEALWTVSGTTVDPRVLEDRPTRLVVAGRADVVVRHSHGRTIYHQRVMAPTVAHAGTVAPVSRGATCAVTGGGLVGCPFTDGDLTTASPVAGTVTVDLGGPTEVGLVVVRGAKSARDDDVAVEGSPDGSSWDPMPHRLLDGAVGWSAGLGAGRSVPMLRYLRVRVGERVDGLAEISAFAPTDAERSVARSRSGGLGGTDSARAVLAAGLALLVGGAALGTRRRQRR